MPCSRPVREALSSTWDLSRLCRLRLPLHPTDSRSVPETPKRLVCLCPWRHPPSETTPHPFVPCQAPPHSKHHSPGELFPPCPPSCPGMEVRAGVGLSLHTTVPAAHCRYLRTYARSWYLSNFARCWHLPAFVHHWELSVAAHRQCLGPSAGTSTVWQRGLQGTLTLGLKTAALHCNTGIVNSFLRYKMTFLKKT